MICPDLRGFGWSDAPAAATDKRARRRRRSRCSTRSGSSGCALAGHDWGGFAGFLLCTRGPRARLPLRRRRDAATSGSSRGCGVGGGSKLCARLGYMFLIASPVARQADRPARARLHPRPSSRPARRTPSGPGPPRELEQHTSPSGASPTGAAALRRRLPLVPDARSSRQLAVRRLPLSAGCEIPSAASSSAADRSGGSDPERPWAATRPTPRRPAARGASTGVGPLCSPEEAPEQCSPACVALYASCSRARRRPSAPCGDPQTAAGPRRSSSAPDHVHRDARRAVADVRAAAGQHRLAGQHPRRRRA